MNTMNRPEISPARILGSHGALNIALRLLKPDQCTRSQARRLGQPIKNVREMAATHVTDASTRCSASGAKLKML